MALFKSPVGEEIETLFKAIPGFKGFLSLVELDADKVLAVVLYETETHANAAADSPLEPLGCLAGRRVELLFLLLATKNA